MNKFIVVDEYGYKYGFSTKQEALTFKKRLDGESYMYENLNNEEVY